MFLALAATKYFKNHQKAFNYISTTKINEINPEIIKIKNQLKQEVEESFEKEKNELREKLNTCFDKTQKLLDKLNKQYYEIVDPNNSLKIYKEYLKSKIN
jgi:regulator of replication initiation timing